MLFVSLIIGSVRAQNVTVSINPEIDSLNAALLKNPDDRSFQLRLIQAYTLSFNPELALLEILSAEVRDDAGLSDAGIKGRVQMSLEQVDPALRSLEEAYLETPADETLMLVAIMEYAHAEPDIARRQLERLHERSKNIGVDLLHLYERFFLNGRKRIAGFILKALQETDQPAYRSFFPAPQVSILSPSEGFATEASQTSVIVEVHHTRPLQSVRVGDSLLVNRKEASTEQATENVSRSFSPMVPLREGRNTIVVEVADIFGNTARDSVHVNGMNFSRLASWSSPLLDSLRTNIEVLRNYVPDSVLVQGQMPSARALIVSTGPGLAFDRGVFLHEYLTNQVTGLVPASNAKILVGDRVEQQNIGLVCSNWLLRGATFQSTSIVYLGGMWRISEKEWNLLDPEGKTTNLKPILEELGSTAAAGAIVLIDGSIDQPAQLSTGLNELVQHATIPLEAIVLSSPNPWQDELVEHALRASSLRSPADSVQASITVTDLAAIFPGSVACVRPAVHPAFAWNPLGAILRNHKAMFQELTQRLSKEKVQASVRSKILQFSRDWKRYNEVRRYLSNQLSLADFIVRVEEYESRSQGAK